MAKMYRQGDILIIEAEKLRAGDPSYIKQREDKIVAYGEVTGHKHEFVGEVALMYYNQNTYVQVNKESQLVHDEHDTIVIPEGFYRVVRQREFDGEHIRQVTD